MNKGLINKGLWIAIIAVVLVGIYLTKEQPKELEPVIVPPITTTTPVTTSTNPPVVATPTSTPVQKPRPIPPTTATTTAPDPRALTLLQLANETDYAPARILDGTLTKIAQERANEMRDLNYFSHQSPTGRDFKFLLNLYRVNYTYAGENLAKDFTSMVETHKAWMASPTHRANIMNPNYHKMGIGFAQASSTLYVAVIFTD